MQQLIFKRKLCKGTQRRCSCACIGCLQRVLEVCPCALSSGSYLTVMYLLCKLLYAANCVGQLLFLPKFIGANQTLYGWNMLCDLYYGRDPEEAGLFPRITWCDFKVRSVGRTVTHVVCIFLIKFLYAFSVLFTILINYM